MITRVVFLALLLLCVPLSLHCREPEAMHVMHTPQTICDSPVHSLIQALTTQKVHHIDLYYYPIERMTTYPVSPNVLRRAGYVSQMTDPELIGSALDQLRHALGQSCTGNGGDVLDFRLGCVLRDERNNVIGSLYSSEAGRIFLIDGKPLKIRGPLYACLKQLIRRQFPAELAKTDSVMSQMLQRKSQGTTRPSSKHSATEGQMVPTTKSQKSPPVQRVGAQRPN